MEVEPLTKRSSETDDDSVEKISILVVDDDVTCLSSVSMMLKKWKYQVVTVKHPMDALSTLRIKGDSFDLVLVEVHIPDMNGFELQQVITNEFDLPVVLMSADDKESTIMEGLEGGAAFFIVKPVELDDLRDLWQYTVLHKNKKSTEVVLNELNRSQKSSNCFKRSLHEVGESSSSINENGHQDVKKEKFRRKHAKKQGDAGNDNNANSSISTKKAKVVWTDSLHNKFLEAIIHLGLANAVPKKILDAMKVPGLTRENVSSHLQKYRISLRKVADASSRILPADQSLASTAIQSNIASKGLSNICQFHQEVSELQKKILSNSSNPNSFVDTYHDSLCFAQQAGNGVTLSGYGQLELVYGEDNVVNTRVSEETLLYKANQLCIPVEANKDQICEGIVDDQRVDAEKLTNFTQNKDAEKASDSLADVTNFIVKSHHNSNQCLDQEASSLVGFESKMLFPSILSDHTDKETRMQLPSFFNNVGRGEKVGIVLDPVSVFHKIDATKESCRFGDLSISLLNQENLQAHQQFDEDGMSFNFNDGNNQDREYLQLFDQAPFKQQDHKGLTESVEEGVPQLHNDLSYATEQHKDEELLELTLASSPYKDAQNLDGV